MALWIHEPWNSVTELTSSALYIFVIASLKATILSYSLPREDLGRDVIRRDGGSLTSQICLQCFNVNIANIWDILSIAI